jgi:hypothetical protein
VLDTVPVLATTQAGLPVRRVDDRWLRALVALDEMAGDPQPGGRRLPQI